MALREFLATGSLKNFQVFSELPAAEVCATLQVRIPAGYPTSATPKVFVERSRGIGDVPRHVSVYDVSRSGNVGLGGPQY
jgi:hypothetical protein